MLLKVSRDGFSSSGEGLNLSQDAFKYVPAGILDLIEVAQLPAAAPLADREVTVESPKVVVEPKVLHESIRKFQGTPLQLIKFCAGVPVVNAQGHRLRNPFFFAAVIQHGTKGKAFFPLCKGAFEEAIKSGQLNSVVCINYMKAAAAAGDFAEVKRGFDVAWEQKHYELETFHFYMNQFAERDFDQCRRGYFLALNSGLADVATDNIWIFQNGRQKQYDVALSIFKSIRHDGADATSYAFILYVLGQMGDFKQAQEIFEEAKEKAARGEIEMNEFIVNNFMMLANKLGKFSAAVLAYRESGIRSENIEKSYQFALKKKTGGKV